MPKWTNKGHEFDELGNYFKENKNILILGYDNNKNNEIKKKLDFLADKVKITSKKVNTVLYYLIKHFGTAFLPKNTIIVVEQDSHKILRRLLSHKSVQQNKNVFMQNDFFEKYLSIFAVYVADIVYSPSNSFICTTICNLNCKSCLNFQPYNKNKHHYDINELKNSIDIFFNAIDRIGLFHISGGEPQLYPNIIELIEYIYSNYKHKIETLGMVTNAFIVPSDELCNTLKKCEVQVGIDDYRKACPAFSGNFEKCLEKFKQFNIDLVYQVNQETNFFVLFPPKCNMKNACPKTLEEKFTSCANPFTELKNGKLYNCNWSEFAIEAGLIEEDECESYDLRNFTPDKKTELVEYRLGYSTKGYVEFCKYCNGSWNINKIYEPAAIQANGLIEWDEEKVIG